jgi:VWFA-related protein
MKRLVFALLFTSALAAGAQQAAPPVPMPAQTPASQKADQPAAQAPAAADPNAEGTTDSGIVTLTRRVNEVNLIFTVTDKHGHYIPNLQQSDFALLDDQKAPARVRGFHQQINLPLRVGIVVDTSTSIRTRFEFEQQSAIAFLLQILKARSDRAFVMGFNETPNVTQDWTNNVDALETGVNHLYPAGGTALFDAVYYACRDKLLDISRGQEPVRKAMVLLTDGNDNQSRVHEDEAIKMCQRSDTLVYSISTNWTPSRGRGDKVLQEISEATGGQVFFPPSVEEVSNAFTSIEQELRSQYALTYTPADFKTDGSFRPIYLYCHDRRFQVRTRKGYFATEQ